MKGLSTIRTNCDALPLRSVCETEPARWTWPSRSCIHGLAPAPLVFFLIERWKRDAPRALGTCAFRSLVTLWPTGGSWRLRSPRQA